MSNEIDKDIEKRNKLSKILEYSFINDAAKNFLNRHSIANINSYKTLNENIDNKNHFIDKWLKYSSSLTRVWLNYLDNREFEDLVSKKLKVENFSDTPHIKSGSN